jgi:hypothetical protein
VRRFPYGVFYVVEGDELLILAVAPKPSRHATTPTRTRPSRPRPDRSSGGKDGGSGHEGVSGAEVVATVPPYG